MSLGLYKPLPPIYLGDAVYASHDLAGGQIWLHLNDHRSEPLIALEAGVLEALIEYAYKTGILVRTDIPYDDFGLAP